MRSLHIGIGFMLRQSAHPFWLTPAITIMKPQHYLLLLLCPPCSLPPFVGTGGPLFSMATRPTLCGVTRRRRSQARFGSSDGDALKLSQAGGGVSYKGTYEDFELELEWNISSGGTSGIMYRVSGPMPGLVQRPEMRFDDQKQCDGKGPENAAGRLTPDPHGEPR